MKTFLKILLAVVLVLVIAMFAIGKAYHFEKSIVINAPVEKVWQNVNSMRGFNQWNPWMKMDPNMKLEYSGTSGQVGDQYCWEGNDEVGKGCHIITALIPNQKQSAKMLFKEPFESDATSDLILTPQGNTTKVTWDMDCELDYPMNLMGFFMTGQMDKSYGDGLNKLKEISEK
ncbi:SRPBCC family protein [Chryseobacterium sp.]|uniref:SRPBCC family protein n=1 Tax=Chryseobacterium sp. TaxID=1871047 RepID=UPI0011CB7EB6|nr:SRPBCC family protein [Chryseobacterium sp.]TXF77481.1 SRPBCC family protein [Chryseobacterium sp.]